MEAAALDTVKQKSVQESSSEELLSDFTKLESQKEAIIKHQEAIKNELIRRGEVLISSLLADKGFLGEIIKREFQVSSSSPSYLRYEIQIIESETGKEEVMQYIAQNLNAIVKAEIRPDSVEGYRKIHEVLKIEFLTSCLHEVQQLSNTTKSAVQEVLSS